MPAEQRFLDDDVVGRHDDHDGQRDWGSYR